MKVIRVVQLYPRDMNIYGDWGNTLAIAKRLEWHGYRPDLLEYNVGDVFPKDVDIIVGGGGQDSGQSVIVDDLQKISPLLHKLADNNIPMLVVCGLYQLFGSLFITSNGKNMPGIGIFDAETHASHKRLIGNVVVDSIEFGDIVGYENHSGQTTLRQDCKPLGTVLIGAGNNDKDSHEGARYRNVIGTYLHGALLPKNPKITDWIIEKAVSRKYGSFVPSDIDESYSTKARETAKKRPR